LVWRPVGASLPADTRALYVCPDAELARLPWAALPGATPGSVLLEEYALAVLPHAPFLLEQLRFPLKYPDGPGRVLALGGVRYSPNAAAAGPYTALPGTEREVRQLQAVAPGPVAALAGAGATVTKLRQELPQSRYAHLATHGFFDEPALAAERRRQRERLER